MPHALKMMLTRVFPVAQRELITTAATFWVFLRHWFKPLDIPTNRSFLFNMCTATVFLTSLLTFPMILRKPRNNAVFLAAFGLCGMSTYFFGYYIHEKHLQYAYIGFILNFGLHPHFLTAFSAIISYTLFYMGSINSNHIECLLLTSAYLYCMYAYEAETTALIPYAYTTLATDPQGVSKYGLLTSAIKGLYQFQVRYKRHFIGAIVIYLLALGIAGLCCLFVSPLRQFLEAHSFDFIFSASFVMFFYVYLYMWACLYMLAYDLIPEPFYAVSKKHQ